MESSAVLSCAAENDNSSYENCRLLTTFTVKEPTVLAGPQQSAPQKSPFTTKVTNSYHCHRPQGRSCCYAHPKKELLLCCPGIKAPSILQPWVYPRLQSDSCSTCSYTADPGSRAFVCTDAPDSSTEDASHMTTSQEPQPTPLQASQPSGPKCHCCFLCVCTLDFHLCGHFAYTCIPHITATAGQAELLLLCKHKHWSLAPWLLQRYTHRHQCYQHWCRCLQAGTNTKRNPFHCDIPH